MHPLTSLENDIITYLIAENKETGEQFEIAPYICAFSGAYSKHASFFLGQPENGRIVLFIQKEQFTNVNLTKFTQHGKEVKQRLYNIADFIIYLVERDYVRSIHKSEQERIACSLDAPDRWRRYNDFYSGIMTGLTSVCLSDFVPKLKLYELWSSIQQ
ncbi:MAG: hypothetical protein LBU17_12980 [Treponema sp.]|jgi:hypothetical protein|nr:hypothetical protein [Treponema sp.]